MQRVEHEFFFFRDHRSRSKVNYEYQVQYRAMSQRVFLCPLLCSRQELVLVIFKQLADPISARIKFLLLM